MNSKKFFYSGTAFMLIFSSVTAAKDLNGFLTAQMSPDSLAILPPPPEENSAVFSADKSLYESGRALRNTERARLAREDADYKNFGHAFSPAFGMAISKKSTPEIYQLLTSVLQDSHDYAMRSAKNHYKRVRPFVIYSDPTCTHEKDKKMAGTGSYPSGHASFGWAAALVLAEINPDRKTEILRRGYDFGESRVLCGAHWQSDVDAGRLIGAAVVAVLHDNSGFNEKLRSAKTEFAQLKNSE
ncbi:phosphatase PAP2 family protein [Pantoea sp. AMG 501]|uniref:acid phosphatase n=1 Tax=Pantoea sp. AMG 501 TaxID=2008894 RepID=UPI000B5A60DF|nr:phosphatase PAP2 family protein [Pantoea sp. AMG 501]